jgi:hypothetical protein
MLNRTGEGGEASILYGDADYQVLKHGAYVTCAVTGTRIALDDLKYWSVDAQEAYVDAAAGQKRWQEIQAAKQKPE